ncbi:GWxTD domain-containing protein [Candidatus Aminicenantes bacterium AH-873-B07]|jgi:GWxTD domain-containing protein|nr:GWxTD domain-containing protein [Candidatus Aminicenantes bacterium AH-873-B07]
MKHKFKKLFLLFFILSVFVLSGEIKKKSIKDLPLKYRKWLEEEVIYIITPKEREVFLQLETDRERDLFIEAFWKHRDPTPGTPENEFKTEHYRRIAYANHMFGRGTPKPGWKTDRGRYYIILGPPQDVQRFEGKQALYPSEVWFYQGMTKKGLVPAFYLVFIQRGGTGEYVLYSPAKDGPQAFMPDYWGDPANYIQAYEALKELEPDLARVSLSLIPGEESYFGRPSLASEILIQNINLLPQRQVNDKYAEKLLKFKDIVEVEYTANYIDNRSIMKMYLDPKGIFFLYYIIQPERLSIGTYESKYYSNLKLNGKITDLKGKIIFQYEKSVPLQFSEEQLSRIKYIPFNLYDMIPLTPGNYRLSILLKNTVSMEFTSIEEEISIPSDLSTLQITPLVLAYKVESLNKPVNKPFTFGNKVFYCVPDNTFCSLDTLYVFFQIFGLTSELKEKGLLKYTFYRDKEEFRTYTDEIKNYSGNMNFLREFSLREFPPAHYKIKVSLLDASQKEVLFEFEEFDLSPLTNLPRPWIYTKLMPNSSDPIYSYILGSQWFNKGRLDKAEKYFEEAYNKKPESIDFALSLAKVYSLLKDYTKVIKILSPFKNNEKANFELYYLLGKAHQMLGEFNQAISIYDEAISHFGINIHLLNSLGECYSKVGNIEEALHSWKKSLEINPNQKEIKDKIESLKKGKDEL